MATRYKITFDSMDWVQGTEYKRYDYTICTCLDERKAIVIAVVAHTQQHPESRIYQVSDVERLPGDLAEMTDIDDRMEY